MLIIVLVLVPNKKLPLPEPPQQQQQQYPTLSLSSLPFWKKLSFIVLSLDVYDVQRRPTLVQGKQIITCDCGIVRSGAEALVSQGTNKSHSGARSSRRSRVLGGAEIFFGAVGSRWEKLTG